MEINHSAAVLFCNNFFFLFAVLRINVGIDVELLAVVIWEDLEKNPGGNRTDGIKNYVSHCVHNRPSADILRIEEGCLFRSTLASA